MQTLPLHEFHAKHGARFFELNGCEVVANYGNVPTEYAALTGTAALLDLSFRSRLCLVGADRVRFLHGQVTNDIKGLQAGQGCYAALITAKGRMESDLNVYCLKDELLLDFEPGLAERVSARLEKYIIADDVQVVSVNEAYGLLSLQGPAALEALRCSALVPQVPTRPFTFTVCSNTEAGEVYVCNQPRSSFPGYDLYLPQAALAVTLERLFEAVRTVGGALCGFDAMELARVEAGIPRYGWDMDETTIPLEAGLEQRAISFQKGCYIGQEVISRIKTYGQVTRRLLALRFEAPVLPAHGDKLMLGETEVGFVTSAASSPRLGADIGLGYVRKEVKDPASILTVRTKAGDGEVRLSGLPFALSTS